MTPIAGTAVTSLRSAVAAAASPVATSTVPSGRMSVLIGFIATRTHEWLTGRHPPFQPAGAIRLAPDVAGERAPGRELDLVMHLGAGDARRLEARSRSRRPSPPEST